MYRFLAAVLFCTLAQATAPLPQHGPPPRASQVGAQPEIVRTAAAGVNIRTEAGRDKRPPLTIGSGGNDSPSEPPTRHMVLAAAALIAGIAIRRYGVSRK